MLRVCCAYVLRDQVILGVNRSALGPRRLKSKPARAIAANSHSLTELLLPCAYFRFAARNTG